MTKKLDNKKGFTLVELSIVLVIIGLIVGGILVGQDLVKSAQIRATVAQIQQYDAAANTFRGKYDGIPGDISKAFVFGLVGAATDNGNGDGRLDDGTTVATATNFGGELAQYWAMLSAADMIDGSYSAYGGTGDVVSAGNTPNVPQTKIKRGSVIAMSESNRGWWIVGAESTFAAPVANWIGATTNGALTPVEAFGIDSKIDNGSPTSGTVIATAAISTTGFTDVTPAAFSGTPIADECAITASGEDDYNVDSEGDDCAIRLRMQN